MSLLPGQGAVFGAKPQEITYLGSVGSASNLSSYTFAGQALGPARSDRIIILGGWGLRDSAAAVVSSMTVGGVATTEIVKKEQLYVFGSNLVMATALHAVLFPAGLTADLVLNFNFVMDNVGLSFWRLNHPRKTVLPFDFDAVSNAGGNPIVISNLNMRKTLLTFAVAHGGVSALTVPAGSNDFLGNPSAGKHVNKTLPGLVSPSATVTTDTGKCFLAASW